MAGALSGCAIAGKPVAAPVTDEWRDAVVEAVGDLGAHMGPVSDAMAPQLFAPDRPPQMLTTELGDLGGAVGAAVLAGG